MLGMPLMVEVFPSTEPTSTSRFQGAAIGQWELETSPLSGSSIKQVFRRHGHASLRWGHIPLRLASALKVALCMCGLQAVGDWPRQLVKFRISGCILLSHDLAQHCASSKMEFS
jgi:hypothetical protein